MDPVVLVGAESTGHKGRMPLKFRSVESENPLPEERKKWCEEAFKVIQIAGAVARRIVPYAEAGDHAAKGDRLGLIRLGSRCDLLIPEGQVTWHVQMGQRVFAGSTQVA